jgi:hypothetical protein
MIETTSRVARGDLAPPTATATCPIGKVPMPAREGTMPIPEELKPVFAEVAKLGKKVRAKREKRRQRDRNRQREDRVLEREQREAARTPAQEVWRWLQGPVASGLRKSAQRADLWTLELIEAVHDDGSEPARGGWAPWTIKMLSRRPGLRVTFVQGAYSSFQRDLNSRGLLIEVLPLPIMRLLASE